MRVGLLKMSLFQRTATGVTAKDHGIYLYEIIDEEFDKRVKDNKS